MWHMNDFIFLWCSRDKYIKTNKGSTHDRGQPIATKSMTKKKLTMLNGMINMFGQFYTGDCSGF